MTKRASRGANVRLVPPTGWGIDLQFCGAPRLPSFDGATIGLLANGKANSEAVLELIAAELAASHRIAGIVRATKPHPSLPVSDEVLDTFARQVQVVLTAIGD
jgi:hypothetical protein